MTRKYTRVVLIYEVLLVVDSSIYGTFGELLCMPTFNKHVASDKQQEQIGSYTKKASLLIANQNNFTI